MLYAEICVFLALTDGRGRGRVQIRCIFEETNQSIFATPIRRIQFGRDPVEILGMPFRIRDCLFPFPGVYSLQLWYNNELLAHSPLRLR